MCEQIEFTLLIIDRFVEQELTAYFVISEVLMDCYFMPLCRADTNSWPIVSLMSDNKIAWVFRLLQEWKNNVVFQANLILLGEKKLLDKMFITAGKDYKKQLNITHSLLHIHKFAGLRWSISINHYVNAPKILFFSCYTKFSYYISSNRQYWK